MTVSDDLKGEAWSDASDLPLQLIQIDHADLSVPIRVVNNKTNITSNGDLYVAFPFELALPDSLEDAPPRARLQIDNVSREIGQAIRTISTPASVTLSVVRQDDPDTVEITYPAMTLTNVQFNALSVQGDLAFEDLTREPYPAHIFSPAEFPGIVG